MDFKSDLEIIKTDIDTAGLILSAGTLVCDCGLRGGAVLKKKLTLWQINKEMKEKTASIWVCS